MFGVLATLAVLDFVLYFIFLILSENFSAKDFALSNVTAAAGLESQRNLVLFMHKSATLFKKPESIVKENTARGQSKLESP